MNQKIDHMAARTAVIAQRLPFIDIARFYGIALVFYGHFIESYMKAGSFVAAMHYKWIYSFHMPLFFILSGYIAKQYADDTRVALFLKRQAASRLIPYAFFSTLLIIPTFWITDFTVGLQLPSLDGYLKGVGATLFAGFPYFNIPTWFLICLFVVEFMHFLTARYLTSSSRVLLIAFGFYLVGSTLAWNASFLRPTQMLAQHGKIYPYFMILEAFTAYSLYLVGVYFRRKKLLMRSMQFKKGLVAILGCAALVFLTFDLNKAMFRIPFYDAVIMFASSHGNPILFPLTAITGSIMVILLAKLSVKAKSLAFLGANSLTIFCLNGVFYHLINDSLAKWLLSRHDGAALEILISGLVVSAISLFLTLPFVFLFNRFVPQLIGKPRVAGPLLPRLVQ